jgi:hypothetical protein
VLHILAVAAASLLPAAIITVAFRFGFSIYGGRRRPLTWQRAARWGGITWLAALVLFLSVGGHGN